jgi:hypothetical protein
MQVTMPQDGDKSVAADEIQMNGPPPSGVIGR